MTSPDAHRTDPIRPAADAADGADPEALSMPERMVRGLPYIAQGGLERTSAEAARLCAEYQRLHLEDRAAARLVLEELLAGIGTRSGIRPPLHVDYGTNISIGDRVFVNFGLTVLDICPVRIGDDVQIGPHVQLLGATHPLNPTDRARGWEAGLPITIEDNVWLGGGAIIMPGVTVGAHSVVGAGAVVTRDVPPYSVAVGSPARVIRTIDPQERSGQFAPEQFPEAYRQQIAEEAAGEATAGTADEAAADSSPDASSAS